MSSVVFCYAPEDAAAAREIGEYLTRNLPLTAFYEEGLLRADFDLVDAVGRALSAEIAIVLLSPESLPKRLERERWEPVFLEQPRETGSYAVFVQVRECRFPALLKRQPFADLASDRLAGLRRIKRLLIKRRADGNQAFDLPALEGEAAGAAEALVAAVADAPTTVFEVARRDALRLAHGTKEDFEGAFWIDASYRSPAGIVGEIGQALGLDLSGSLEQNTAVLREFLKTRRCLFLFEHFAAEDRKLAELGGLASSIVMERGPERPLLSLEETQKLFTHWPKNRAQCVARLGDAREHIRQGAVQLGPAMLAMLKNYGRLAEAEEILGVLIPHAVERNDEDAVFRYTWDRSWIWGHWGEPYNSQVVPLEPVREPAQLGFDFG